MLPGPTINIHAAAKPLLKLMYHRQALGFIAKDLGWNGIPRQTLAVRAADPNRHGDGRQIDGMKRYTPDPYPSRQSMFKTSDGSVRLQSRPSRPTVRVLQVDSNQFYKAQKIKEFTLLTITGSMFIYHESTGQGNLCNNGVKSAE
jgi:hypothetical protein